MTAKTEVQAEMCQINQERLYDLIKTPCGALFFDLHGFIFGRNPDQNRAVMESIADYVRRGGYFAGITGFGEAVNRHFIDPFTEILQNYGVDPATAPVAFATRNGALIRTLGGTILRDEPIPEDVFQHIIAHPLVRAMNGLNQGLMYKRLVEERADNVTHGMQLHPKQESDCWGMRVDFSPETRQCYQITGMWGEWAHGIELRSPGDRRIQTVRQYCNGTLPSTPAEMATLLQKIFENDKDNKFDVELHTSASHPEIDIVMAGSNKATACKALEPIVAEYWHCTTEQVADITIPGGDSPFGNDAGLLAYSPYRAVTNNSEVWPQISDTGPIMLDLAQENPIANTKEFIDRLAVLEYSFCVDSNGFTYYNTSNVCKNTCLTALLDA